MTRVLIIGSSHVNRLRTYVNSNCSTRNFSFGNDPLVRFYGISGSRGNKKEHCTRWERVISDIRPHHLVFHAGGNDLDQNSCEGFTEEMVFRLLSILSSWRGRYSIQTITVLQLTGRRPTYNVPVDKYNFIVCQHLKRELKSHSTIIYWNLRNMKNCISNIYLDGVHFNAEGNLRYYRNVSGAIINAIRSVWHN
jgi:lysophospholipase L1-like esterase